MSVLIHNLQGKQLSKEDILALLEGISEPITIRANAKVLTQIDAFSLKCSILPDAEMPVDRVCFDSAIGLTLFQVCNFVIEPRPELIIKKSPFEKRLESRRWTESLVRRAAARHPHTVQMVADLRAGVRPEEVATKYNKKLSTVQALGYRNGLSFRRKPVVPKKGPRLDHKRQMRKEIEAEIQKGVPLKALAQKYNKCMETLYGYRKGLGLATGKGRWR
jgi:hypothetical protein